MLLPLLAAVVVVLPASAQDADLKWDLKKYVKKPFYQTMTTETKQTMKVQGSDVVQEQNQTFYFKWTVKEVDEKKKTATVEQEIVGLNMTINIGGSKISYDSANDQAAGGANPLSKFFEALKSAKFTLTLDTEKMTVSKIDGQKEFVTKLVDANPQMKPLLEKILSDKALREMSEPIFSALPGTKKKKGETWDRTAKLDMGPIGEYETKYKYTYEGPNKDKDELIKVKTTLAYTPPPKDAGQGLPFKIKEASLKGEDGTGEIVFDPKAGWVKSLTMNQSLKGDLVIEIGQQSTKVELNQTQKTTVTTSLTDPVKKKS
jgi:hypothetical protein